jgi:transcriptional regulator with GAF, ATPase, and Fis domain
VAEQSSKRRRLDGVRVLVVEDGDAECRGIGSALRDLGADVDEVADAEALISRLTDPATRRPDAIAVATPGRGDVSTADSLVGRAQLTDIVAESPSMREAIALVHQVAASRSSVLITGETGTGKEIIAGMLHHGSGRPANSFIKVNCAALPESLLESELFGHERGAFTGADRTRIGRFEQANGGTLFLDEIGDMTLATQVKLLRVLQAQEFNRLGGTRVLRTDARIVAATNQDLALAQREGRFREDLYFRLDVVGIHLPPLRERPEDLVLLAERLLVEFALEHDRKVTHFSAPALDRIRAHAWPGNVRELRNVIERACLTCSGDSITTSDIVLSSAFGRSSSFQFQLPASGVALGEVERQLVLAALERTGYVQKDAAALLSVSSRKLNYMIHRMGITHPSWRRNRSRSEGAGESPSTRDRSD